MNVPDYLYPAFETLDNIVSLALSDRPSAVDDWHNKIPNASIRKEALRFYLDHLREQERVINTLTEKEAS